MACTTYVNDIFCYLRESEVRGGGVPCGGPRAGSQRLARAGGRAGGWRGLAAAWPAGMSATLPAS